MGDIIVFSVIAWVVVMVICFGIGGDDVNAPGAAMILFWPVVLPVLAFVGFFYALWSALRLSIGWFIHE